MSRRIAAMIFSGSTLFALFTAVGSSTALGWALELPSDAEVVEADVPAVADADEAEPSDEPATRSVTRSRRHYVQGILARNIFDHRAIGKEAEGSSDEDEAESDLEVRVVATLVAFPARFSSALIVREGANAMARSYGVGDKVLDAEIIEIHVDHVRVRRGSGTIEKLEVKAAEEKPRRTSRRTSGSSDVDDQIQKTGANEYVVDRTLVDEFLQDPTKASRLGRARPHRKDGEVDGYRLYRIRRNSPGYKLGIRNGDVVHAINGHPLTSMSEAMNAYQALQSEGSFEMEVTRRGKKRTLKYDLR